MVVNCVIACVTSGILAAILSIFEDEVTVSPY